MADLINIQTITNSPTTIENLTTITILNGSALEQITLTITGQLENFVIDCGQTISLSSEIGLTLPDLTLIGDNMVANVVSTT